MKNLKEKLKGILLKIKGNDNYLTTETVTIGLIAAVFIIAIVIMVLFPRSRFNQKNLIEKKNSIIQSVPTILPTPTLTPIPIISGPETYGISTKNNPQMRLLQFNEFDPKIGKTQTITLEIKNTQSAKIISVEAELITDNKSTKHNLNLISGTLINGKWSASWTTDDTHLYRYRLLLTAKDENNNISTANLGFR